MKQRELTLVILSRILHDGAVINANAVRQIAAEHNVSERMVYRSKQEIKDHLPAEYWKDRL